MMSSNTFFVFLVIFNLLAIHYAYRIDPHGEELLRTYEENQNDDGKSVNLKSIEEINNLLPCHPISSSYILCKKLDQLSRRDTGFLRFGRKR